MRKSALQILSTLTKSRLTTNPLLRFKLRPLLPFPSAPRRPIHTLDSAATRPQILAAVAALDSSSSPSPSPDLGPALLKAAALLDSTAPPSPADTLALAVRALNALQTTHGAGSLPVANALRLLGSAARKLSRFHDSLDSLNTAEQILTTLLSSSDDDDVSHILAASADVQSEIFRTKSEMGRQRDGITNLRRSVELKVKILDPEGLEMAHAYKELAEAYISVLEFDDALKMCTRALEIWKSELGEGSAEVARIRRLLVAVYTGLGDNEAALEQNELARTALKALDSEELVDVEIEAGNILIALGRMDEAISILQAVGQKTEGGGEARAFVLISMAKALIGMERFPDAKQCLEISTGILNKTEMVSAVKVAGAFAESSMLYEMMAEFEIALSLMQRTLAMLEKLPQERQLEGSVSARIGWLLLLTGRVSQSVPYLEGAIDKLKESFGLNHFGIGFVYRHLGQAYLEMNKPQSALKMLGLAKDIICASFGPHHEDSIDIYQCLANAYGTLGSYALAMQFQQRVIDALERNELNGSGELREAKRLLEQLKKKEQGSPAAVFPANTLPLPWQK